MPRSRGAAAGAAGSHPIAAGVAPDGTYYVVIDKPVPDEFLVVRMAGGGPFSVPKPIFVGAGKPRNAGSPSTATTRPSPPTSRAHPRREGHALAFGGRGSVPSARPRCGPAGGPLTQLVSDRDGSIVALWNDTGFHSRLAVHDGGVLRLVEADLPQAGDPRRPSCSSARRSPTPGRRWSRRAGTSAKARPRRARPSRTPTPRPAHTRSPCVAGHARQRAHAGLPGDGHRSADRATRWRRRTHGRRQRNCRHRQAEGHARPTGLQAGHLEAPRARACAARARAGARCAGPPATLCDRPASRASRSARRYAVTARRSSASRRSTAAAGP